MGKILIEFEEQWYEVNDDYRARMINVLMDSAIGYVYSEGYDTVKAQVLINFPKLKRIDSFKRLGDAMLDAYFLARQGVIPRKGDNEQPLIDFEAAFEIIKDRRLSSSQFQPKPCCSSSISSNGDDGSNTSKDETAQQQQEQEQAQQRAEEEEFLRELLYALWSKGYEVASNFVKEYRVHFEQALDEDLHAPSYAFCRACLAAGLPIDRWATRYESEFSDFIGYIAA